MREPRESGAASPSLPRTGPSTAESTRPVGPQPIPDGGSTQSRAA
jgi:hypothetical protein